MLLPDLHLRANAHSEASFRGTSAPHQPLIQHALSRVYRWARLRRVMVCAVLLSTIARCGTTSPEVQSSERAEASSPALPVGDTAAWVNGYPIGAPLVAALAWRMIERGPVEREPVERGLVSTRLAAPPDERLPSSRDARYIEAVVRNALRRLAAARVIETRRSMQSSEITYLKRIASVRAYIESIIRELDAESSELTSEQVAANARLLAARTQVRLFESNMRLIPFFEGSEQRGNAQVSPR